MPRSFAAAFAGMCHALVAERNMKIHYTAANVVLVWALCVRPPLAVTTTLVVVSCLVMAAELVNTAVERVVDLASEGKHSAIAKAAKDTAAGAALMVSAGAIAVGGFAMAETWPWHWRGLSEVHMGSAVLALVGLVMLWIWGLCVRYWRGCQDGKQEVK